MPLLGSFLLRDVSNYDGRWLILSAALILLGGISWKIRANYYKIFCLGTYIAVVHERRGKDASHFQPGPLCPGWHTRWRKIDSAPSIFPELKGKLGRATAQADAAFLGAIAVAQLILTVGKDLAVAMQRVIDPTGKAIFEFKKMDVASYNAIKIGVITVISVIFLIQNLSQMWDIQRYVGRYREELEAMVREKRC